MVVAKAECNSENEQMFGRAKGWREDSEQSHVAKACPGHCYIKNNCSAGLKHEGQATWTSSRNSDP